MTNKLYYDNSYLRSFQANIISIEKVNDSYLVELDKTAFYHEGGGQPSDTGKIGGIVVKDIYEKEGLIFHLLTSRPEKQNDLDCFINWERRFDHMQQHTAQHLLSALLAREYQAKTVGFHLGEDYVSIDLDRKLAASELKKVELDANQKIYQNIIIKYIFPDNEELKELDLRKEPVVEENIRIVVIDKIDLSPCGGTHLKSTAEIGLLKIIGYESYKGGIRLKFLAGERAFLDYRKKHSLISELSNLMSVQEDLVQDEVMRLKEELDGLTLKNMSLNDKLMEYEAGTLLKNAEKIGNIRLIKKIYEVQNFNSVRRMASKLMVEPDTAFILGQRDEKSARLIMGRSEGLNQLKMNDLISEPLNLIAGQGGGNEQQAQGGGSKTEMLIEAVEIARNMVQEAISKS